jgi:hypothetical protein
MSESIQWMISAQVKAGPTVSAASTLTADAYEKVQVTVANGDADKVVNLAADPLLLVVTSSKYQDAAGVAGNLSYKINNAGAAIPLVGPLMLIGKGAVDRYAASLTSVSFTSTIPQNVTIDILTAKDATP